MKNRKNIVLAIIGLLFITTSMFSQGKVDFNTQLKTMHYWRGLKVTNGVMTGTSVGYFSDNFSAYAWAGLSFDGTYKEVTNVLSYTANKLCFTLIDIYNFSGLEEIEYFNYKKGESGHLVDLTLSYDASFMKVSWSTILYGNDLTVDVDQKYSTYLNVGFPIQSDDVTITPFIAPAFVLNSAAESSLYGDEKFGIANIGMTVAKTLKFQELEFPTSATLGYNAMLNQASVQLAISLF